MLVSTFMTLFVVPAAYSVLDDFLVWNEERRRRGAGLFGEILGLVTRRERTSATGS
jgi:hypothetical protein